MLNTAASERRTARGIRRGWRTTASVFLLLRTLVSNLHKRATYQVRPIQAIRPVSFDGGGRLLRKHHHRNNSTAGIITV